MALQNRVQPTGQIVADPARGMFTGNRGILDLTPGGLQGARRWSHPHWIICTLTHPRGLYHGPMPRRAWTPLFFLDEAVAIAAGHRPCAYCRPAAFAAWKAAWAAALGPASAPEMDRALHVARVTRARAQVTHREEADALPDGTFIKTEAPALIRGDASHAFTPAGYAPAQPRPSGMVTVLTPAPAVAVLRAGYAPALHGSLSRS